MENAKSFRLPRNVVPLSYDIHWTIDLENFRFEGKQSIAIDIQTATREIRLNAKNLKITAALLVVTHYFARIDKRVVTPASKIIYDDKREFVTIRFPHDIEPGNATLHIKFEGKITDDLCGLYRSRYKDADGKECSMVVTQFEPTDARRAFPCFDEPDLKARFHISVTAPRGKTVISNMPQHYIRHCGENNTTSVRLASPPMSTYLVFFAVGDFEYIEDVTADGIPIRVYTTPGKSEQGRFALNLAKRLIPYYADYFGHPYPLPKVDLIAIPDFAAGAMENWGAVTFRESVLLVDQQNSSAATLMRVAGVVAHELAHFWFGNLITMKWWNDLWLNEGFATWLAYKAMAHFFPEWEVWTQFVSAETGSALHADSLSATHPVQMPIKTASEISQMFDSISYEKGGSVLRTLEAYLGETAFRDGMRAYIASHAYANATSEDLWIALEGVSGKPIKRMMRGWTLKSGYPVVHVKMGAKKGLCVQQQRFFVDGGRDDRTLWQIPIGIISSSNPKQESHLLSARNGQIALPAHPDWLKINPEHTGFYRTHYAPQMLKDLVPLIAEKKLSPIDRWGIANDMYALARAGLYGIHEFLDITEAYRTETDFAVWNDVIASVDHIGSFLAYDLEHGSYDRFVRRLLDHVRYYVGWAARPDESHGQKLLRGLVLHTLGKYQDTPTIKEAQRRFSQLITHGIAIEPDLRAVVYALVAQDGDERTYQALIDMHKKAESQEEKRRILSALGAPRHQGLLKETLRFSISPDVRNQDTVFGIAAVAQNPCCGRELAWNLVRECWDEFKARYGEGKLLDRIVEYVVSGFETHERKLEVEEFFAKHPVPKISWVLRQSLERIELRIRWIARHRDNLCQWLRVNA